MSKSWLTTRAGAHLRKDARAQAQVDRLGQVERQHVGFGDRGQEQVFAAKCNTPGDAGVAGVGVRLVDAGGIDIDAEAARAQAARGGDQDAAVARAQIDDPIVRADLGQPKHRVDHLQIARDIGASSLGWPAT